MDEAVGLDGLVTPPLLAKGRRRYQPMTLIDRVIDGPLWPRERL